MLRKLEIIGKKPLRYTENQSLIKPDQNKMRVHNQIHWS